MLYMYISSPTTRYVSCQSQSPSLNRIHHNIPHYWSPLAFHFLSTRSILSSVFRTALPGRRISLLSSWLYAWSSVPLLFYSLSLCLHLSVSSASHPLKAVLRELNKGTPYRRFRLPCKTISGCYENSSVPSRYNGHAFVRCLGNYSCIPSQHILIVIFWIGYRKTNYFELNSKK
jgi:hypothetical protein